MRITITFGPEGGPAAPPIAKPRESLPYKAIDVLNFWHQEKEEIARKFINTLMFTQYIVGGSTLASLYLNGPEEAVKTFANYEMLVMGCSAMQAVGRLLEAQSLIKRIYGEDVSI